MWGIIRNYLYVLFLLSLVWLFGFNPFESGYSKYYKLCADKNNAILDATSANCPGKIYYKVFNYKPDYVAHSVTINDGESPEKVVENCTVSDDQNWACKSADQKESYSCREGVCDFNGSSRWVNAGKLAEVKAFVYHAYQVRSLLGLE